MTFRYRTKRYIDEEGEYSEYLPATRELLLVLIAMHWTNETMPNGLEIISIANSKGDNLLLEHSNKHVFEVYYLPAKVRHHFHKKSIIDVVLDALDLFFKGQIRELEAILNKTRKDNRYIRGDFFFINHNYQLTKERNLKEGAGMVWTVLPVVGIVALSAFSQTPGLWRFPLIFGLIIFSIAWLPGVYLHLSYIKDFTGWTVKVTKGQDKILVNSRRRSKVFDKSDIYQVVMHTCSHPKVWWSLYGFAQIEFRSGEIINLSSLVCDILSFPGKFPDGVTIKYNDSWLPTLQHPSRID